VRIPTTFSKLLHDIVLIKRKSSRLVLLVRQFIRGNRINQERLRAVNRILLIRLQRLGDLMMTRPVIVTIRKEYPEAEIDIVTAPSVKILQPLFVEEIDNWFCYDSPLFQSCASSNGHRTALTNELNGYDLIIDFDGDPFTLGLARALRPRRYLSRGLTRINEIRHRRERRDSQLELLSMISEVDIHEMKQPSPEAEERKKQIEIHPFSGANIRDMDPKFWPELIVELKKTLPDFQIVLTGYGKEAPAVAALAQDTQSSVYVNDRDDLHRSFRQTVALVICPDTFTMHFAASLGAPVIALFGPQTPARFSDFYPTVHSIYHQVSCSPCGYNNFGIDFCPYGKQCTQLITVDEVVAKAKELLSHMH